MATQNHNYRNAPKVDLSPNLFKFNQCVPDPKVHLQVKMICSNAGTEATIHNISTCTIFFYPTDY